MSLLHMGGGVLFEGETGLLGLWLLQRLLDALLQDHQVYGRLLRHLNYIIIKGRNVHKRSLLQFYDQFKNDFLAFQEEDMIF